MSSLARFRKGTVALAYYRHADQQTLKKRPVLIIQDYLTEQRQVVVAMISSTMRTGPTRVSVLRQDPLFSTTGLLTDSTITLDNVQTIDTTLIERVIGVCKSPIIDQVDEAMRVLYGL